MNILLSAIGWVHHQRLWLLEQWKVLQRHLWCDIQYKPLGPYPNLNFPSNLWINSSRLLGLAAWECVHFNLSLWFLLSVYRHFSVFYKYSILLLILNITRESITLDCSKGGCTSVWFKSSLVDFALFSATADSIGSRKTSSVSLHSIVLPSVFTTLISIVVL